MAYPENALTLDILPLSADTARLVRVYGTEPCIALPGTLPAPEGGSFAVTELGDYCFSEKPRSLPAADKTCRYEAAPDGTARLIRAFGQTVDICAVDLYTGICEFLKAGAAATFIRRDHWVEAISSESLAAGLVQRIDFDTASRKLYHGDCLVMMTDGVLDALPSECEEETMKEIILDVQESAPREISRGILERVLGYSDYRARDDMTVLVASVVRK